MSSNQDDTRLIQEEYRIWKKNCIFLYDLIMTHALEWPSLTVQWLPGREVTESHITQNIILGTHTSEQEQNYLIQARVTLPNPEQFQDQNLLEKSAKLEIKRVEHPGEVNKARYMPQKPNLIATKTVDGPVKLYDMDQKKCLKDFLGHTSEGYGLDWSVAKKGLLASSGDDEQVCVWDVEKGNTKPLHIFKEHGTIVEDVSFSKKEEHLLISAGDDKRIIIYDLRSKNSVVHRVEGHKGEVNCVDTSPHDSNLFVAGDADHKVKLWDLRKLAESLHDLEGHKDEIFSVQWNPSMSNIVASSGSDRRAMVWDLDRIGTTQSQEDEEDGPPELLFCHGGHTSKISDISWNPEDKWALASVAEDNILQMWSPSEAIYSDEPNIDNIPDSELE